MLQIVAKGLGELVSDFVFVGGAVTELYANNPAASDIRSTFDIDCIVELGSRIEFAKLEERLRTKGFSNDISFGAPICRWVYKGINIDIMPTDSNIIGFTNRWYNEAIDNKTAKYLTDSTKIFILPVDYFLATKFEAHKGRGGNDLRQSHDFEDIIFILDNFLDIMDVIRKSNPTVKQYLKIECQNLIENPSIIEGIETALPYGSGEESCKLILKLIHEISKL